MEISRMTAEKILQIMRTFNNKAYTAYAFKKLTGISDRKVEARCGYNPFDLCSAIQPTDLVIDKLILCFNPSFTKFYIIDTRTFPRDLGHKYPDFYGENDYRCVNDLYCYNESEE